MASGYDFFPSIFENSRSVVYTYIGGNKTGDELSGDLSLFEPISVPDSQVNHR
jgi:hypothetical protein